MSALPALLLACTYSSVPPRSSLGSAEQLDAALITVAGGRFNTANTTADLTYLIDTRVGMCFVTADYRSISALSAVGIQQIDCCALRSFAPAQARSFFDAQSCTDRASGSRRDSPPVPPSFHTPSPR
jgi:hypothetical protein